MGAFTIAEFFVCLFLGLAYYILVFLQGYNVLITGLLQSTLVVGQLDYVWLWAIGIGIASLPLPLIIGLTIAAFNRISYVTGWG